MRNTLKKLLGPRMVIGGVSLFMILYFMITSLVFTSLVVILVSFVVIWAFLLYLWGSLSSGKWITFKEFKNFLNNF